MQKFLSERSRVFVVRRWKSTKSGVVQIKKVATCHYLPPLPDDVAQGRETKVYFIV